MEVRLSFWARNITPQVEAYWIMANSANLAADKMDVFWTNRKDFNRVQTTCSSQYFPPQDLPDLPPYVNQSGFGIVSGNIELWLKKLKHGDVDGPPDHISLNKTIDCERPVSSDNPNSEVYNCSIVDPNFDRLLEHRDALKFTFKTEGGGYMVRQNLDTDSLLDYQDFSPVRRNKSVEFRFDFADPFHCEETNTCSFREKMLEVPDVTTSNPISITWSGWQDDDSGMDRYAWEVFKMTKTAQGGLEIQPALALSPLINQEVLAANYTPQSYQLPGPGMYSVILEAGDLANNTKYTRRLVFYDPDPRITTDPQHDLYATTASAAANYSYQNDLHIAVIVTWDQHFRNAFHEEYALLGSVRQYPAERMDGKETPHPYFVKVIPFDKPVEDHEGLRTVAAIPNKRGIVSFAVQYAKDHDGGLNQPQVPRTDDWTELGLNTNFTVLETPSEADTVTVWVRAKDILGTQKVGRTQVTFDSSPPHVQDLNFHMNVPVQGIDFSSTFALTTKDAESGIAYIVWTFTRLSNNSIIHQHRVEGIRVPACIDITTCSCTPTKECFAFNQTYSLSNCLMMVEKENLATEVINVTADVTNMAGLVTRVHMLKDDLTALNGTEAYYPPQNITVKAVTTDSVTIIWSFPPSCFPRTGLWVIVNGEKRAVHKDAQEFAVTGLESGTQYTIFMVTDYGPFKSDKAPLQFSTQEAPSFAVGAIIGIIIGVLIVALLIALIIIFVLWRRGKIFQKEGTLVNKQLHHVSRVFNNVRKTVKGGRSLDAEANAFQNNAYKAEVDQDEIYMYGSMAFGTRQTWQLDDSSLTLLDHVAEGKFATIYKATWQHDGKQDTVATKMLKSGFSDDDALKMMAKINFLATQLEDHDNIIRFLGAVTDNHGWGPVLVMEFCEMGQMDKWLVQNRDNMSEQVMENLFHFTLGIAKGMEYIASKRLTHKRLAARNVLLTFLLEPKVAGFGPQQKDGIQDKATRVPAKWAAPEVLQEKPSTEKSDVWSYGVVMWEIFSMGEVPYPGIHASEVGTHLKSGYRMDKPEFADDIYYDLMRECWQYKQSKRPTFGTIRAKLAKQFSAGNRQSVDFYYDTNQLNN